MDNLYLQAVQKHPVAGHARFEEGDIFFHTLTDEK